MKSILLAPKNFKIFYENCKKSLKERSAKTFYLQDLGISFKFLNKQAF